MADTSAPEDATVTFHVKSAGGAKHTLTLPMSTTTIDLKNKLATEEYANVPASAQRLIYSGKVLKDGETLATHSVKEGNTMHLVKSAPSNQRQTPASQQTPSSTTSDATTSTPQVPGVPQNLAAGTGNDPLAGLTGARYAGFTQLPSASMFQNPPSQEDMIRQLQDPNFAQMMREAMNNPQFVDMMVNSHPQLRAMGPQARQMLQSDHFRRMMTDPEAIRSMMQMQQMMGGGMGGMGGAGQEAFPAPGATNTTDNADGQNQNQGQQQPPPNPFAALGGNTGANPFGSLFGSPPPQYNQQPGTTTVGGDNPTDTPNNQAGNPFAALFNPAMFGGQQGQQGGNNTDPASQQQNPLANNPFLQNPDAMRNLMQAMGGGAGGAGGQAPNWMDMFGGGGGAGGFGGPPDNRPPEERYATQLRQLNEMGFHDFDRNIQALSRSGGDVNGALEHLFSQ